MPYSVEQQPRQRLRLPPEKNVGCDAPAEAWEVVDAWLFSVKAMK